ncbi:MAG: Putative manganese efflux pump MntP [Thermoanaerobacterales bacterium 50_218]|nr:MAG: Putative manganese efflux pump MntP [Thermoanaerobacterales bacterium 50_218]HAA89225.1 hypothetical protein [Peptococcaceae bacterium]
MDLLTVFFIALGLAMDAFAVSVTSGITMLRPGLRSAFPIAFSFGFFQGFMPVVGWLAATSLARHVESFDHWVAFGLLSFIGFKMIYHSGRGDTESCFDPLDFWVLLMLAVATSIDALAVGISFAFLQVSIIVPVLVIGAVTFLMSLLGVFLGKRWGYLFGNKVEVLGGLILIGIGLKILLEHLV